MLTNQLAHALSPYLQQHKDNPVAWQLWSDASLQMAKQRDLPILLSVGYAACHWCHVMAHESFENHAIAAIMNSNFINIKVDREERPDVDHIYMSALHALGEQGGWPLTMFLTPDGQPFWGGTYFPPEPRYGRPGFPSILRELSRLWTEDRSRILNTAQKLTAHLVRASQPETAEMPQATDHQAAIETLIQAVDLQRGGLRGAPKFPQAPIFSYLQLAASRTANANAANAVHQTLHGMLNGGIYDQLGGGLCRYSTDADWLVPHFEKMLYDNAQLISLLARQVIQTPNPYFERRIIETLDFLDRELTTTDGLFASSLDADQDGEEGRYYTWKSDEIEGLLDAETFRHFATTFHVFPHGNWEDTNVLTLGTTADPEAHLNDSKIAAGRKILLAHRTNRTRPPCDDKVLTDWNALMITTLVEAGLALKQPAWITRAEQLATDLLQKIWVGGQLRHAFRGDNIGPPATANDYAYLIQAHLKLYAGTGHSKWISEAIELLHAFDRDHLDSATGLYHLSAANDATLICRPQVIHDDVTPAANSLMIENLYSLAKASDNPDLTTRAYDLREAIAQRGPANPFAAPSYLHASMWIDDAVEITLINQPPEALVHTALAITGLDVTMTHISDPQQPPSILLCRKQICAQPAADHHTLMAAADQLRFKK